MAVQVTYPGIYVQEVPSGVRTIVGVSTSIGCFVGRTKSGPLSTPIRTQTLTDFARRFGDNEAGTDVLTLSAVSAGILGDPIRVGISYKTATPESTFNVVLFQSTVDGRGQRIQANREAWNNLSMDPSSSSYAPTVLTQKSALVSASDPATVAPIDGCSMSAKPIEYDSGSKDTSHAPGSPPRRVPTIAPYSRSSTAARPS